jgi:lysophospholipase L1-like esterase
VSARRVIAALLVAPVLVAAGGPARAQAQPPGTEPALSRECQTYGVSVTGTTPLPNSERALRERKVLRILAIGAAPARGLQHRSGDYLHVIEQMLERMIKGLDVQVVNRGVSGELAANAAEGIKTEVALEMPDLVLWQVGTSDAFARVPIHELRETVVTTIRWLKQHRVDVALVGVHYLRNLAQDPEYQAIRWMLKSVGEDEKIVRIGRYEATQLIERALSQASGAPADEFALTEDAYGCLAEYAVRAITSGLFARNNPAPPRQ